MFGPVQSQWIIYLSGLAHSTTVTAVSSAAKALWVVVMYTMNNHTMRSESVTAGLTKQVV